MKLRNKKTGEIAEPFGINCINGRTFVQFDNGKGTFKFEAHSLAELNEEWEDYEEPKEYWRIDCDGTLSHGRDEFDTPFDNACKSLGNYFETKEEAEKAVEKLKTFKRLKDKGFSIYRWDYEFDMVDKPSQTIILRASAIDSSNTDLDLLFSGGED